MTTRPDRAHHLILKGDLNRADLVSIEVPGDGSCLFHSILRSTNQEYISSDRTRRKELVVMFRKCLAAILPSAYDKLANGNIKAISESVPEFSLENLQKRIYDSREYMDNIFTEFISDQLGIDIYLLSRNNSDLYMMGADTKLLYKNRPSIVIIYTGMVNSGNHELGHYEPVGILNQDGTISTLFSPAHEFVTKLRFRLG